LSTTEHAIIFTAKTRNHHFYRFRCIGHGCNAEIIVIRTTPLEEGKVYAILLNQLHSCPKKRHNLYHDEQSGRALALDEFSTCYQILKSIGRDMSYAFENGFVDTEWISTQEIQVKDAIFTFNHFRSTFLAFKSLFGEDENTKGSDRVYSHLPPNFNVTDVVSQSEDAGYIGRSGTSVGERAKGDRGDFEKSLSLRTKFGAYRFKSKQLFVGVSESFASALEWAIINLFVEGLSGQKQVINVYQGKIRRNTSLTIWK